MPEIELPHRYIPRPYQRALWDHFVPDAQRKRAVVIAHRRWGKDKLAMNLAMTLSQIRVGTYWHILPFAKQARAVVWNGFDTNNGIRLIDHFPKELIDRTNENEMRVHFRNQSVWQAIGGDDIDRHVGTNPIGVVISEWAIIDPSVWDYIRPILRENKGWCLHITTIRGKNHAYKSAKTAEKMMASNPNYLYINQTIDDTGIFTAADIEEERASGMSEQLIRQEYYNDPEIPLQGAYYASEIARCYKENRITSVPYDPKALVHTYWDIGYSDFTVVVFAQVVGQEIHVIDCYANSGEEVGHYARVLKEKDYNYGEHYGPWDVELKHLAAGGKSVWDVARALGIKFRVTPQPRHKMDGIEQVRNMFPSLWFDKTKCERLIEAASSYRKELLPEKLQQTGCKEGEQVYKDTPLHDWCFTGDTEVLTDHGRRQILGLPYTGRILTPCGIKQYINPRITQKNASLVEVKFKDGFTVKCTPEHLFLTESGWKSAVRLQPNTPILSCSTRSLNTLTAGYTGCGQEKSTTHAEERDFIEWFGLLPLVIYLQSTTSTTLTPTQRTMLFQIFSAYRDLSIDQILGSSITQINQSTLAHLLEQGLLNGTKVQRGDFGISDTLKEILTGQSGKNKCSHAIIAERSWKCWLENQETCSVGALSHAKRKLISSVKHLSHKEDVWDITVPGIESFALANGSFVHNCSHYADALAIMAWNVKKQRRPVQLQEKAVDNYNYV